MSVAAMNNSHAKTEFKRCQETVAICAVRFSRRIYYKFPEKKLEKGSIYFGNNKGAPFNRQWPISHN